MAASAQASVPIPEGLDLDEWFVPPPPEPVSERAESSEKKSRKSKKGKEKQVNGGKKSEKKKKAKDVGLEVAGDVLMPVYDEAEPPEDLAELERVCSPTNFPRGRALIVLIIQRKAERLSQLRDDPYYIMDDRPKISQVVDVDSIPVVRLDDVPAPSPGTSLVRFHSNLPPDRVIQVLRSCGCRHSRHLGPKPAS